MESERKMSQVCFLALAMFFGFSLMTFGNAAQSQLGDISIPKEIQFESKKLCGNAKYSSIVTGTGAIAGLMGGAVAGSGIGGTIGGALGLACDTAAVGTAGGLCTIAGVKIGTVIGGAVGGAVGAIGADWTWNGIFGEHNCAAAIYTYEKGGKRVLTATSNSESIRSAQRYTERRIKKLGGSNILFQTAFDGWEVRCAAYGWGRDGEVYIALGPSRPRAHAKFYKLCEEGKTECYGIRSLCNSWKWFAWDHWGF